SRDVSSIGVEDRLGRSAREITYRRDAVPANSYVRPASRRARAVVDRPPAHDDVVGGGGGHQQSEREDDGGQGHDRDAIARGGLAPGWTIVAPRRIGCPSVACPLDFIRTPPPDEAGPDARPAEARPPAGGVPQAAL